MGKARRRQLGGVDRLPSGRWRVRLADPTSGARLSIGTFATKAEAERAFAAALADQERGGWVAPERGRVTLAEYSTQWLAARLTTRGEPLRPRVRELYGGYLDNHILPTLGHLPLGQLTTPIVRRWHAELGASGLGRSTIAKCYRLLRAILNTAIEDHHLVANPCRIKGAGIETSEERSIPDIDTVYVLADLVSPRNRALVLLAAFCGLRKGELFALRRRDVDLLHRVLEVRSQRQELKSGAQHVGPPKSDAGRRTLAIPSELVPELEAHLDAWVAPSADALLFVGERGAPLRAGVWQREWDRARHSIGLPELRLHDLRHVAGTLAAATGASTKEIMRRLGHSTQDAALRYQHATDERDRQLADGIDRLIRAKRAEPSAEILRLPGTPADGEA
ncbi:MAG: tyrosine-type recombinase/integrase [Acidimicrobiales bacterium]